MIELLAFIEPPTPTTTEWLDTSIEIMQISQNVASKIYPLIMTIGLLRTIVSVI